MANSTLIYNTSWVYLTLQNGFENFGTSDYQSIAVRRISPTIAELYGVVKRLSNPQQFTLITQLPINFYPKNRLLNYERKIDTNIETGRFDILTNGRVEYIFGDTTSHFRIQLLYSLC